MRKLIQLAWLTVLAALLGAGLGAGVRQVHDAKAAPAYLPGVARVTYYVETGYMYSGNWTYDGAAGCSWDLPIGTHLYLEEAGVYLTCEDRGMVGDGSVISWIDVSSPGGRPWWLTQDYYTVDIVP